MGESILKSKKGHQFLPHLVLRSVRHWLETPGPCGIQLCQVANYLRGTVGHYNWVGFYVVAPDHPDVLHLGPYSGDPTDHVRIPFGSGVCGQVAQSGEAMVVQDVRQMGNYLACSLKVRSEIVVPVRLGGAFVGELDIDSHTVDVFSQNDLLLLAEVAEAVAPTLDAWRRQADFR